MPPPALCRSVGYGVVRGIVSTFKEKNLNSFFEQHYQEILTERKYAKISRTFDTLKETLGERSLVLYGAGELGSTVLDICAEKDIQVACICDRRASGVLGGVPVISLQTLQRYFSNATVIVCSFTYNEEIIKDLKQLGFGKDRIVPCPIEYPQYASPKSFQKHIEGYAWAYDFFEDEVSRQTILDRLRMYLCETSMNKNTDCDQYYEYGLIKLGKHEIFVDGGAYNGDSVISFIEKIKSSNGDYTSIYAFEPDTENYTQAIERTSQYSNIEIIPKGLWNKETVLTFFVNKNAGGHSFVVSGGGAESRVSVTSLDTIFYGKPDHELPTFIKMDIEGAEKEALIGTTEIIRRVKPKMAICAYHKPEDIYELPRTILSIRDDYRFALRHHVCGCYDTVLYVV